MESGSPKYEMDSQVSPQKDELPILNRNENLLKTYSYFSRGKWSKIPFILLTVAICLIAACGMKGAPALRSYEKPAAPSELTAIHRESEITLSWTFPKGKEQTIRGFRIMKSLAVAADFEKLAFLKGDERSYVDRDFTIGSTYQYKIVAESLKGIMSDDSNILSITPKNPPAPPQKISLSARNGVELNWASAGEDILYNVYRGEAPGTYASAPLNPVPLKGTSYRDELNLKKPAYYVVRSLLGGALRDEGPASEQVGVDPSELVPFAPVGLRAVATESGVYLTWREPAETWITEYRIYRETGKGQGYAFIGESEIPFFRDKDRPLTKRNYRVTEVGPVKEGPPTEIHNIIYIGQK